jgi:ATP-dependent 26S proteasome regulatory subunit
MHLKRGLLLYGPPGSGKTSTMMYVVSSMPERTTIFVGAKGAAMLGGACELARALQPATIIIDDVDLIAGERRAGGNDNEKLSELLNEMDGIADDADILFLLSTNCPEALEPALAARPGRIDQAICIPLPDGECRRRLFELYGRAMSVELRDVQKLIEATEGASGAFIKELFRKALLMAAEEGDGVVIDDEILERALATIRNGSPMMAKLLAYKEAEQASLPTLELAV